MEPALPESGLLQRRRGEAALATVQGTAGGRVRRPHQPKGHRLHPAQLPVDKVRAAREQADVKRLLGLLCFSSW